MKPGKVKALRWPTLLQLRVVTSVIWSVCYEAELVVALKSGGANISEADALSHVYGYGVGLDMTRQDLQHTQLAVDGFTL